MEDRDLQTAVGALALLESSESEKEWNWNVARIVKINTGFPSFWYDVVLESDLIHKTAYRNGWTYK